ncbi:MAG: diguanylate cyclase (GGDEF)-like protein/PAS domain S-box-containing protein [Verrucomicrobiales bacterium]|jgi:diguanylate cyclase (GGDEF)-like protein/PAS domain S-box-containing protein
MTNLSADSVPIDQTLSVLLSTVPFGLVVIDADHRILSANPAALELLGHRPEDVAGRAMVDLLADAGESPLLDDTLRAARDGATVRRSFQVRAAGAIRGLDLQCWLHQSGSESVVLAMLEASAAQDQERQIRDLIARSPRGMARLVGGTTMTDVNNGWTEATGQLAAEASGEGWLERIDPDGKDDFLHALTNGAAKGEGIRGRLRIITAEGEYRWLDVSTTPLDQPGASLFTFDDTTEDIDAARRADELSRVLEATKDLVGILSPDGSMLIWLNEALGEFLPASATMEPFAQRLDSASQRTMISTALPSVFESGSWSGELTLVADGDRSIPTSAMLVAHLDDADSIEAISIVARDLSELRAAQAQIAESETRLHALVENASDLVFLIRADGTVVYASPAVERVLGHPPGSLDGVDIIELVHPEDLDVANELAALVLETPHDSAAEPRAASLRIAHGDGSYRNLEITANNLLENPAVAGIVLNATDVTDRVAATEQLEVRTYHDDLTGLPNRALLMERLREALRRARERRLLVGLLFLDLDRFNVVNESLGHHAGDELLNEVASRIEGVVRPGDVVARLGGDEFAVVISDMLRRGDAVVAARRLRKALTQPISIGDQTAVITTSIGIAIAEGPEEPEDLLRDADTALHRAKQKGRDLAVVFDDHLRDQAIRRLDVENKLRRAIENDELVVHYQPVLSALDGRLAGSEALVRIRNEDGSLVMPGSFIDVAEDSGLISKLGHQVLVKAIRQTAEWTRMNVPGQEPPSIAVNVSARQLTDANYADSLRAELEDAGLAPEQLSLELTESALIDGNPTTERSLQLLRDLGVRIGLDDFGTGFSSLAYLKRFPISFLKIDRSFVDGLGTDENDSAIVRATIALAHGLNLLVVAEGVETKDQLERLAELSCDLVQGYLFSKPIDPTEFDRFLGMRWSS